MSNVLAVSHQATIRSLQQKGWSQRRIARELGLHRHTVSRYWEAEAPGASPAPVAMAGAEAAKCTSPSTNSTAGSAEGPKPKCTTISTAGSAEVEEGPKERAPHGLPGRPSQCAALATEIGAKLEAGLSAQRIYQDLVAERGFAGLL